MFAKISQLEEENHLDAITNVSIEFSFFSIPFQEKTNLRLKLTEKCSVEKLYFVKLFVYLTKNNILWYI